MRLTVSRLKGLVVALFVVAALAVPYLGGASGATGAAAATPPDLYRANCASCHGADGSGNTPAGKQLGVRDLRSGEVRGMSDAQLRNVIANGKGKMPGFGKKLGGDQINQLVARVRQMH
jgi:mono/diheme cytochrome c family protein